MLEYMCFGVGKNEHEANTPISQMTAQEMIRTLVEAYFTFEGTFAK